MIDALLSTRWQGIVVFRTVGCFFQIDKCLLTILLLQHPTNMIMFKTTILGTLFCLLLCFAFLNRSTAQTVVSDSVETKKSFIAAYPIIFYLPETRLAFGGACIYTYFPGKEKSSNPSLWQMGGAYTLNKQILLYASYQLFLRKNRTELFGEIGYFDYVFPYFGTGNKTVFQQEESYFANFPRVYVNYLERVKGNFRAGGVLKFDLFNIKQYKKEGLLDNSEVSGIEGGVVTNAGLLMRYDSRDIVFLPSKGIFATLEVTRSGKLLGSEYPYTEVFLNTSAYFSIKKNHVLATNLVTGIQNGDVPFYKLLTMGGPKRPRGIIEGRYRDKNLLLLQMEYRFPIYKRFAGVAFASTGRVAGTFKDLASAGYHYNVGGGLRFVLDKKNKLRLRLDVGFGSDEPAFYLTVGEAF
jgi:outer membrane protein assembly factor BamA